MHRGVSSEPGCRRSDAVIENNREFDGFRRSDGRAGTRNYVGIVTSVNCSATVARQIAALADRDSESLYEIISELKTTTPDYSDVIASLLSVLHYVALLQQIPSAYDPSMGDEVALRDLAERLTSEDIQLFYQIGINGRRDINFAPEPSMGVEMTLLRMLAFKPVSGEGTWQLRHGRQARAAG